MILTGPNADKFLAELEQYSGYKLKRDPKTGVVTIDTSVKRITKGTSKNLANKISEIVNDRAKVAINVDKDQQFNQIDDFKNRAFDFADYSTIKGKAVEFAATRIAHVLEEYYVAEKEYPNQPDSERYSPAHRKAGEFDAKVLSDLLGRQEFSGGAIPSGVVNNTMTVAFRYSTITYDVVFKTNIPGVEGSVTRVSDVKKRKTEPGK